MLSLYKTEELINIRLIANIWNEEFNSPEKIESSLAKLRIRNGETYLQNYE
ncbi:hypothetical protein H6F32_16720 [Anabaena sp. FACHB-1237]|uniref:hypothetical protein n=1 Tax=Anabaena sp. FACHB-1237 TaxID=2692769 RepID=UPI00168062BB|nr:hypothetical protein [Anabaena sp. FACHB-1237]MBD2139176.1 hypothetical protein [Anabaena sp. FACHB-1237]